MAKKHEENKDLKSFSRIGRIDYSDHTLRASKSAIIGIRMRGKIDFLTHYCGWHFLWDNTASVKTNYEDESKPEKVKKIIKSRKDSKERSLDDKSKKTNKHK